MNKFSAYLTALLLSVLLAVGTARADPIGGPFTLAGPENRVVSDSDFRGRWMLVYFGYTSCPDACPTDLQRMTEALDALGPLAERIQPLLITLDPARDTPARLAEYVTMFHPRLMGLSGSTDQIDEVAKRFRARFVRHPPDKDGNYAVDHTTIIYLVGPHGGFVEWYKSGVPVADMAQAIRRQMFR
ncbi:SCO family protein [Paramagnetospirillum kuznetsovii]|nr:SCO family protein [Paramagnetospirillum kuznetsovii]